jgi:hypothetical protein
MADEIMTAAEAHEASALPCARIALATSGEGPRPPPLPDSLRSPVADKSPARWAYERLILYIRNFEEGLDSDHEVGVSFAGSNAGLLRIDGVGYFDPDIVTFYGTDDDGTKTQLIQHVTQLNVILRAASVPRDDAGARRIGFRLVSALDDDDAGAAGA